MQTGASALLAASSIATLYGLVHFFDLFRREASLAAEPQRTDFGDAEAAPIETNVALADDVEPAKAPRKGSRRTTGSQKKPKSAEPMPPVEAESAVAHVPIVEEVTHVHVAPLFEPDPFVRMPRQGFGRRGQI
jgi:hypothetical protein